MKNHSMNSESQLENHPQGTFKSYGIGFLLSLVLTLIAYLVVSRHILSGANLLASIVVLALAQLIVQLFFFLHIGSESKPRWNLLALLFTLLITFILVGGTLWIMHNLNSSTSSQGMSKYLLKDEGIPR